MKITRSKIEAVLRLAQRHWFKVLCGGFVFYLLFCGDYSLVSIVSLEAQESALRKEIEEYRDSVANFENRLKVVNADNEQLERYAREHMHMHGDNEDLYLIDE